MQADLNMVMYILIDEQKFYTGNFFLFWYKFTRGEYNLKPTKKKLNSVASSPQANYTNRAAAAC
jgi:hypothetical protein